MKICKQNTEQGYMIGNGRFCLTFCLGGNNHLHGQNYISSIPMNKKGIFCLTISFGVNHMGYMLNPMRFTSL